MHIGKLFHKVFRPAAENIDKRLHRTVLEAAVTLSDCKHLSIAGLGRCLKSTAKVKHIIKRMDRLFGNPRLHRKRKTYYQTMAALLIGSNRRPVIIIDWSGLTRCGEYHFLRASLASNGRAIPLWERTFREAEYMSQKSHRTFIQELKSLLPKGCRPIIIPEAGFRCPWFQLIRKMGWDFVGRVRHTTQYCQTDTQAGIPVKALYSRATRKARYLFVGLLAKANPVTCYFCLYRGIKKHRVRKNLRGKKIQCSVSLKHEKREREPWLIVSSLSVETHSPIHIITLYKKRMQIEEAFRDLKNTNNGFSLRHCRSFDTDRLDVALLIGAVAMLLLWIMGTAVKHQQQHYHFQANTIRRRNVLSILTIGWQHLKRNGQQMSQPLFFNALNELKLCTQYTA